MTRIHLNSKGLMLASSLIVGAFGGAAMAEDAAVDSATAPVAMPKMDFLDAAYVPGLDGVVVVGHHGMVGKLTVGADSAKVSVIEDAPDQDFTALARYGDDKALLGSSTGRLYSFDGKTISEIAALSEYDEPILDIAVDGAGVWVVGARGLVAYSADGSDFEALEIRDVTMPVTQMPGGQPADWYFGVSNIDSETIEFTATVGGEPAIPDEHYIMYPDEGFVQVQTDLDMDPPPTIGFKFNPGPPFRLGDVSWNVVIVKAGTVTIAGEFGMIFQSQDNGESWVRRDVRIVPREPEPAYWMAGAQRGEQIWLTGAAGVSAHSEDAGVTWMDNPKPGREGIFGISLENGDSPVISGAVGLIGNLNGRKWSLADRTALKLLSWLRTPVAMPDGSLLITGGRATAIRFQGGEFTRVPVVY